MFPAENKVESLPAAPSHSCSGPFFVFFQCLFFLYLAWLFLHSYLRRAGLPGSQLHPVFWAPSTSCEGPGRSGGTGIKLLKVYTQAVLIFTYK